MNERGDNDDQPTYHVGTPPQATYYTPPPRKRRRTTPLWATVTTGAVEALGLTYPTAARWVALARAAGHLSRTDRGRASGLQPT